MFDSLVTSPAPLQLYTTDSVHVAIACTNIVLIVIVFSIIITTSWHTVCYFTAIDVAPSVELT